MTTLSSLRSGIKSIQAGTITLNGVASNTATISSVDTAKALVIFNGLSTSAQSGALHQSMTRVSLTNATTVTANKDSSSSTAIVAYTVVEFN